MNEESGLSRIVMYLRDFRLVRGRPIGGTSNAVHGLASALARRGVEVVVLSGAAVDVESTPTGYTLRVFESAVLRASISVPADMRAFLDTLPTSGRRTLVVLNGLFQPSVHAVSRVLTRAGLPYVFAPHGVYSPALFEKRRLLKSLYWGWRESRLVRDASAVQLLDLRHAQHLQRLGITTPVFEVPNGFSAEATEAGPPPGRHDGPVRLLYFGRVDWVAKGLDLLLEAMSRLRGEVDLRLDIQGLGSDSDAVRRRIEETGSGEIVRCVAADYDSPVAAILSRYDVVCLPSRHEGFGLSALEGMAAGRLLLVAEAAGIAPHVQRSGGGVLADATVDSVAGALRELVRLRSEWPAMGNAAREYALAHLTWDKVAEGALAHYQRILDASVGAARSPAP